MPIKAMTLLLLISSQLMAQAVEYRRSFYNCCLEDGVSQRTLAIVWRFTPRDLGRGRAGTDIEFYGLCNPGVLSRGRYTARSEVLTSEANLCAGEGHDHRPEEYEILRHCMDQYQDNPRNKIDVFSRNRRPEIPVYYKEACGTDGLYF